MNAFISASNSLRLQLYIVDLVTRLLYAEKKIPNFFAFLFIYDL